MESVVRVVVVERVEVEFVDGAVEGAVDAVH